MNSERPAQVTIPLNGKQFVWNKLPTTPSTELFFDLSPALLPALVECATMMPFEFVPGEGFTMLPFRPRELTGLPEALRKALKELPFPRFQAIATRALRFTTVNNQPLVSSNGVLDQKAIDLSTGGTKDYLELVGRALALQYGDFYDALAELGLRLRGPEQSPSPESNTSAGQSTES